MSVSKTVSNKRGIAATLLLLLAPLAFCRAAYEQETAPLVGKYAALGRDFLRALYPDLNGKGYVLSISAPIHYDDPDNSVQQLELDIGDNFKDITLGYWGGWTGEKPKHFEPGPIHPKQYLSAFFGYEKGQLQGFLAKGPAVGNPEAEEAIGVLVRSSHPEMTDAEASAALKKAGAKYGREDKEIFVRALPIAKLEHFVGKLSITSVELKGVDEDKVRDPSWPHWTVLAKAQRADGHEVTIKMYFEPFKGDLEALYAK